MATLSPPRIVFHLAAILVTAVFMLSALQQAQAQIYSTPAEAALLMDAETGTVLFSKNPDTRIPPASLAKIMTMEVVFDQLKRGKLKLDDRFFVSENAWRNGGASSGGSTMFAKLNSEIRLEDLIRGVVIQSANDGSIIIAEGLAGSEQAFANLMNQRARQIGLDASNFTNSTGLPDPEQYVTIRDLAKLARYIIREYPNYYRYYREKDFEWNNIRQRNRNPLLASNIGADGMKTGYTEESGYGIVGTAKREGRRLVAVLSGMTSKSQRAEEARKILDWGFRAFEKITLFEEGEILGQASVYGGEKPGVYVVGEGPVSIYLPIGYRDKMKARIVYTGPLMPPVAKGSQIASLKVWIDDELSQETKLYAAEDVNKGGLQRQAVDALKELLFGWL